MITNLYWRVLVSKEMRRCVWLVGGGGLLSFSRCIRERHTKKSRRKRYVSFVLPSDRHMQRRVVAEEVIAFGRRHRHAHCRTTYSLYTQPAHHLRSKLGPTNGSLIVISVASANCCKLNGVIQADPTCASPNRNKERQ